MASSHPCPLFWHFYIILILWHSYFNFGDSAQCSDTHKILISDMFQLYWWLLPLYWASFQLSDTLFCFNRVLIYDWLPRQFHLSEAFHHLPDTLIICLTLPSISGNTVYFLCRFRAIWWAVVKGRMTWGLNNAKSGNGTTSVTIVLHMFGISSGDWWIINFLLSATALIMNLVCITGLIGLRERWHFLLSAQGLLGSKLRLDLRCSF